MNIIVCVKQIRDPEAPPSSFSIDAEANQAVLATGVASVVSTFDEYAVEAAIRVREKVGGKVTVVSMGDGLMADVVKKPLAMGADELILLEDPAFTGGDSWSTAHALSLAIKKIGDFDMILCGRQAADWDYGQVGAGIAELLELPSITLTRNIEVEGTTASVERVIPDGYEKMEVELPALFTVSNESAAPRYPTVKGVMGAKRKKPTVWKPEDIGADPAAIGASGRRLKIVKLFQPEGTTTDWEIVEGDTPVEAAEKLAILLKEAKVI